MTEIPAELTDRVIDFLHSDKHSLAACSLVCKSWLPASRYHLFHEFTITSANARSFVEIFEPVEPSDMTVKMPRAIDFSNHVRSICCEVEFCEPEWPIESIMRIISSLPFLSEFRNTLLKYTAVHPPLKLLKNLKKLSADGGEDEYNAIPEVAAVIANSPELKHLDFSSGKYFSAPPLQDIFANISPDSPPLNLEHFGVRYIHLSVDANAIPHLRSLTSLEWVNPFNVRHTEYSATSLVIWPMLASEGVRLSRLKTTEMNDKLLDYLSSFQGLTDLHLEWVTGDDNEDSDHLAKRFFHVALPRHADSLKFLGIDAAYEGDWCFGKHNQVIIMNCTKLEALKVSVCWPPLSDDSDNAPVDLLLNSTTQLSHLRAVEIRATISPAFRNSLGRHASDAYRRQVYLAIFRVVDRFEKLDGDDDVPDLPGYELRVNERRMFVPRTIRQ